MSDSLDKTLIHRL